MVERGIKAYVVEVQAHICRYENECKTISALIKDRPLSRIEYRALERLLQLSIETAIGLAKHWGRAVNNIAPNDACQAFAILSQCSQLSADELTLWRKIIGMRNSLVHDYLDIDEQLVISVAEKEEYQAIFDFCRKAINALTDS